jgi:hypothetical protein
MSDSINDPSALLPPPNHLRDRLAKAMRDVDILSGLLKLAERVARRDGRHTSLPNRTKNRQEGSRG